jgi:uncharacterized protein YkwD
MSALILALFLLFGGLADSHLSGEARQRSVDQLAAGELRHDLGFYAHPACGIAEVVARSGSGTSAAGVFAAWLRSPSHAWVIGQGYDRLGVGVARGPDGATYWTVVLVRDC